MDLEEQVKENLKEIWKPQSGVSAIKLGSMGDYIFIQAMIKDE